MKKNYLQTVKFILALLSYIKGLVKKLEAVGCLGHRPSPTFVLGKQTVGHITLGNVLVKCRKFVIFLFSFLQREFQKRLRFKK